MAELKNVNEAPLDERALLQLPAAWLPSYRFAMALERNAHQNILVKAWGPGIGLGDEICIEPTLRFMVREFKHSKISVETIHPEFFGHIPFHKIYNAARGELGDVTKHYCFTAINPQDDIQHDFINPMTTHCVDAPSLIILRSQLPVKDRAVELFPGLTEYRKTQPWHGKLCVHPGRHWPSKTFPKGWWDAVLASLIRAGIEPVLIGSTIDDTRRGTVDVDTKGCIDLRNQLSLMESVALLQGARVLLTNDSSPMHMAASGKAWIGFLATAKHPDHLTHWRGGQFGWRMENLALGGMYELHDICPNKTKTVTAEEIDVLTLKSWLPEPASVAQWACEKFSNS